MKIINPYTEILTPLDGQAILQHIELCGRVCYKSEDKITDTSAAKFVAGIIKRGHEAVLEHFDITVKFVCDRGVSHEIVRHRMASYCQESTRYCNYSKDVFGSEITVIRPSFLTEGTPGWQYYDNTSLKAKHERKRSLEELTKENKELKTRLQATEEDLTNTQVALTEVYEMLAGGGENG